MIITRLLIKNFRNICNIDLKPSPNFNIIFGRNGSGKTSLLEAVSYLGFAKSFRTNKFLPLINYNANQFTISASIQYENIISSDNIGITRFKNRNKNIEISINSVKTNRLTDLVDKICVQIIHPQGIELLTGGPDNRRHFIDWGVYYTYPKFKELWFKYRHILNQRNALLKNKSDISQIIMWDDMLCEISEKITNLRIEYLNCLQEFLKQKLSTFFPNFNLDISFYKGWENGIELRSILSSNIEKDRFLGYTFHGCHRADLKIKTENNLACDTLSRGQLKLLNCALRLSQGLLLKDQCKKKCIYLVDDFSSEFDSRSKNIFLNDLSSFGFQVFLTNISSDFAIPDLDNVSFIDIEKSILNGV